jgi:hypothetical protein
MRWWRSLKQILSNDDGAVTKAAIGVLPQCTWDILRTHHPIDGGMLSQQHSPADTLQLVNTIQQQLPRCHVLNLWVQSAP